MAQPQATAGTRERLVEAGIKLLGALDPVTIIAAVGTRQIARRAGVSSATFFYHFPSIDQYTDAVLNELYSPTRLPRGEPVRDRLKGAGQSTLPVDVLLDMYRRALRTNLADSEYRTKIGVWALGGAATDPHYLAYHQATESQIMIGARQMLDHWGREARPPFDLAGLVAVGNALTKGAYVHHVLDPDLLTVEQFATTITATVLVGSRPKGDDRTMSDRLAEMNYYPQASRSNTASVPPTGDDNNRERFVAAAAELFGDHGFRATSVDQLAKRVGVHPSTFFALYESKAQLAAVLFNRLGETALGHVRGNTVPPDPVMDHLIVVAELAGTHIELAQTFAATLATDDTGSIGSGLVEPLARTLTDDTDTGPADTSDARDLAEILIGIVIQRVLRRPGQGAVEAAQWTRRFASPNDLGSD